MSSEIPEEAVGRALCDILNYDWEKASESVRDSLMLDAEHILKQPLPFLRQQWEQEREDLVWFVLHGGSRQAAQYALRQYDEWKARRDA